MAESVIVEGRNCVFLPFMVINSHDLYFCGSVLRSGLLKILMTENKISVSAYDAAFLELNKIQFDVKCV